MSLKRSKAGLARLSSVALASGIAFFSLLPAGVAVSTGWSDKIEHGLAFAVLTALGRLGWPDAPALKTFALCVIYGGLIELGQTLSPGRHADVWDLLADAIGAGFGLLISIIISKKWH